jgi:TolB-like protein
MVLKPTLISFSRRLVSDHGSAAYETAPKAVLPLKNLSGDTDQDYFSLLLTLSV